MMIPPLLREEMFAPLDETALQLNQHMNILIKTLFILALYAHSIGHAEQHVPLHHGVESIVGKDESLCHCLQRIPVNQPLFAIIWESERQTSVGINGENRLTKINGIPIDVSFDLKGIYALQRDYSLKVIDLKDSEIDEILNYLNDPKNRLSENKIWKRKIKSRLRKVK